jgi:hypothetical protein
VHSKIARTSGEGKKSKAQAKKAAKDEDRQDAQAKRLEARRLAEEEAQELASGSKNAAVPKKVIRRYASAHAWKESFAGNT